MHVLLFSTQISRLFFNPNVCQIIVPCWVPGRPDPVPAPLPSPAPHTAGPRGRSNTLGRKEERESGLGVIEATARGGATPLSSHLLHSTISTYISIYILHTLIVSFSLSTHLGLHRVMGGAPLCERAELSASLGRSNGDQRHKRGEAGTLSPGQW